MNSQIVRAVSSRAGTAALACLLAGTLTLPVLAQETRNGSLRSPRSSVDRARLAHASHGRSADAVRAPGRRSWLRVESGPVDFAEIDSSEPETVPAAIRVRVFASRSWNLELLPTQPLRIIDHGGLPVPQQRLAWRSDGASGFVPLAPGRRAVIARGSATGPAGQLVEVDLRMSLTDQDLLGRYGCTLQLSLEEL